MSTKMPARSRRSRALRPWRSIPRRKRSSCPRPTSKPSPQRKPAAGLPAKSPRARSPCSWYPGNVGSNILVIEDDLDMAHVLQQGLEQKDYAVTLAHNGWNGLELAQRVRFEAILLDVMLPALDGYELARQLRSTRSEEN